MTAEAQALAPSINVDAVDGLVARAKTDVGAPFEEAALDLLASLEPANYQRARAKLKEAGIRVTDLDAELAKRAAASMPSTGQGHANLQGRPVELPEPDPWPDPVDGAALLDELVTEIRNYVIVSDEQANAVALWSVHTHAHDASDVSPKLVLKSPQKRSGKSRLVEVLERTTARPLYSSGIKPAAFLRIIEMHAPTLLLDELDAAMKQDREMAEALRGLIDSGFSRAGARYIMSVPTPDGGFEPRQFSTWCPQVLAGIGDQPDTVRDRSIEIEMKRKRRDEKVKRLRHRDGDALRDLGRKSARWARDNMEKLRSAQPAVPIKLNDRAADAWEPLLAIADLAEGVWPQRAREAALALSGDSAVEDDNLGTMLLTDIKQVFGTHGDGHISSAELAEALGSMKDRPWAEWRNGNPISQHGLARLLRPYRIGPGNLRVEKRVFKGYEPSQFVDAFARYLPPIPQDNQDQTATPLQGAETLASPGVFNPQQPPQCSGSESAQNPSNSAGCSGVAVKKGDSGENAGVEAEDGWPNLPGFLDRRADRQSDLAVLDPHWGDEL